MRSSSPAGDRDRTSDPDQDKKCLRYRRSGPGRLSVVGLGPGDACLLAPLAARALALADTIVGYSTYLDLLDKQCLACKKVISTGMMGEVERCNMAIDAALAGSETVVVSGGDAGVYGMAGLVLELLEQRGLLDKVPFEVVPGVPAIIGAAALLGAPLTHDFAAVSLSDLLTPQELIWKRIELAAQADFVLGLYNPRSKKRSGLLARAFEILLAHKSPDTPVGMVRNAWRHGQEIRVTRLAEADPEAADMLTIVVVGNSQTRFCGAKMLTPRGYGEKYDLSGREP